MLRGACRHWHRLENIGRIRRRFLVKLSLGICCIHLIILSQLAQASVNSSLWGVPIPRKSPGRLLRHSRSLLLLQLRLLSTKRSAPLGSWRPRTPADARARIGRVLFHTRELTRASSPLLLQVLAVDSRLLMILINLRCVKHGCGG